MIYMDWILEEKTQRQVRNIIQKLSNYYTNLKTLCMLIHITIKLRYKRNRILSIFLSFYVCKNKKIFNGNTASNNIEIVHINLERKVTMRKVRIIPLSGNYGALAYELYGCGKIILFFFSVTINHLKKTFYH